MIVVSDQSSLVGDNTGARSPIAKLFLWLLSIMLLPICSPAQAQQKLSSVPRVGVLRLDTPSSPAARQALREFRQGLKDLGYVEGKNVALEIRWAEDKPERLPALAAELVQLKVEVIVTHGPLGVRAAKEAATLSPIVMGRMDDVVERGF